MAFLGKESEKPAKPTCPRGSKTHRGPRPQGHRSRRYAPPRTIPPLQRAGFQYRGSTRFIYSTYPSRADAVAGTLEARPVGDDPKSRPALSDNTMRGYSPALSYQTAIVIVSRGQRVTTIARTVAVFPAVASVFTARTRILGMPSMSILREIESPPATVTGVSHATQSREGSSWVST